MDRIQAQRIIREAIQESTNPASDRLAVQPARPQPERSSRRRKPTVWAPAESLSGVLARIGLGPDHLPHDDIQRAWAIPSDVFERYVIALLKAKVSSELSVKPRIVSVGGEMGVQNGMVVVLGAALVTQYLDAKYPVPCVTSLDVDRRFVELDIVQRVLATDGEELAEVYDFHTRFSQGTVPCCVDFALYAVVPHNHPKWGKFITTMDELINDNNCVRSRDDL